MPLVRPETADERVDDVSFEVNDVYAVDVTLSTGRGRTSERGARPTVFCRNVLRSYQLRLPAARRLYSEAHMRFPTMPFSLRMMSDEVYARLGLYECLQHDLLQPYPVLFEQAGEFVAQIKFTALLLPSGTVRITGHNPPTVSSIYAVHDTDLLKLLARPAKCKVATASVAHPMPMDLA